MSAATQRSSVSSLPDYAVETRLLSKTYGARGRQPAKLALDSVSLAVPRGSFFGLLGPNGAGKSTLINILAGLVVKSSGSARIWGYDTVTDERWARAAIGVVPQELNLDPFFTPREMLEVQAGLYGVPAHERRTDEILEAVGLADKAHAYARTLSGGMRRRLLVAKAMVHTPPVLVLDEPTAGVDIELRQQLWTYVKSLNAAGTTILLTTHYLEEAEELCDRIAIIDRGRVVANEEKKTLLRRLDSKTLTVLVDHDLTAVPAELAPFGPELRDRRRLTFRYKPSRVQVGAILAALEAARLSVVDLSTEETDLEDIFLQLTRHTPDDAAGR
ncbi:ABC transporter ATP-binding protein [Telmatospirillum siberiense]|uniref:Multidrug ABC transporter ATP-binding protein n=1 Tax=Telmatospirillum siberiense TaxID=382514 RepID=A0A2N3PYE2_9PROT|nr:ABC transporter ATP-binding protein [Telmatospirillum siberiense]PKU25413.1 multidrug ABC transporter ATP-binding protein [Telmatospirillum siberiense]